MDPELWRFTIRDVGYYPKNLITEDEVTCRLKGWPMPINAPTYPQQNPHVVGLENVVKSVTDMFRLQQLVPTFYTIHDAPPPKGMILHGRPGNGKSQVMAKVADECNVNPKVAFFRFTGNRIMHGDPTINLMKIYDTAAALSPSVLFVDEADCLMRKRSKDSSIVLDLLTLLDDVTPARNVVTVMATNSFTTVDPALRRRGRLHVDWNFRNPNVAERRACVRAVAGGWPGVTNPIIDLVAANMPRSSRSDVVGVCYDAALCALMRTNPLLQNPNPRLWGQINPNLFFLAADFNQALGI